MLIVGDLSGIQDFLFDVRESGGKQAASLRFRSFRLQIIAECLARKFLWACGLGEERLLFVAAGKFLIEAAGAQNIEPVVKRAYAESQTWLMDRAHGRLRLAMAIESAGESIVDRYELAGVRLRHAKLRAWLTEDDDVSSWSARALLTTSPWDANGEATRDKNQADILLNADRVTFAADRIQPHGSVNAVAGVLPTWRARGEALGGNDPTISLASLSRHIPRETDGTVTEFVELAGRSRGDSMLGVLKADADSIGMAIRRELTNARDLTPLKSLSQKLGRFFGPQLDEMMSAPRSPWSDLYTVFSGGDDLLLVGPWNIVIDFAAHVQRAFARTFAAEKLTISAGMALIKPKFPIRLAAQQAEKLLEQAKDAPAMNATVSRDQFAGLGDCWKWSDQDQIINVGKQVADWVEDGVVKRSWLHSLLELTLLQREQIHVRSGKTISAMACSRLAYHVARNWPKADAREPAAQDARRWVDTLLKHFDRFPHTRDPIALHLPAVIRYALLATRSPNGEEQ